jgi:uncharacterized membrane protein YcaP (DUF421 family)
VNLGGAASFDLHCDLPEVLARCHVSEADVHEALRGAGLEETAGTRRIVLEPSGKISVLKNG